MKKNPHIGSTLRQFLKSEGLYDDANQHAKTLLQAWQSRKKKQCRKKNT